jgi:hypothetical protein
MAKHAQLKLEIVFFVYLWSIDVDAVKTAMSCFSLFCEEAEIRYGFDEMAVSQLLPNHNVYMELAATSNTITSGRNAIQKKILSLLRKIEHPTQGNKQAWYDTFICQQNVTKLLQNYPKSSTSSIGNIAQVSVSTVPGIYQNANGIYLNVANGTSLSSLQTVSSVGSSSLTSSSFNQEHELDDLLAEWANMTGFLAALSSIWLPSKQQQHQTYHPPFHQPTKPYYFTTDGSNVNGSMSGSSSGSTSVTSTVATSVGSTVTSSMASIGTTTTTIGSYMRASSNQRYNHIFCIIKINYEKFIMEFINVIF